MKVRRIISVGVNGIKAEAKAKKVVPETADCRLSLPTAAAAITLSCHKSTKSLNPTKKMIRSNSCNPCLNVNPLNQMCGEQRRKPETLPVFRLRSSVTLCGRNLCYSAFWCFSGKRQFTILATEARKHQNPQNTFLCNFVFWCFSGKSIAATVAALLMLTANVLRAQGELDSLLNKELFNSTEEVLATFKTTRIIDGHSVERVREGDLDFRIVHRFGSIQGGAYEFFGIDQSTSQFGLEYGVKDYLMLGISRATWQKTTSGLLKMSLLRQRTGEKPFPFSLSYVSSVFVNGLKWADDSRNNFFTSRLSYLHQFPVARKFRSSLSLQLTPTLVHRNLAQGEESNDIYSVGAGGRYKITVRTAIVAEYYYTFRKNLPDIYSNCFSLGFDIETGSHVFQIMVTNSQGITENNFVVYSSGKWNKGELFIGFNICRFFTLKSDKKEVK